MLNNKDIKFVIHEFLDGHLNETQTDDLWAELLGRPDELEYLETLATLKSMGYSGALDSTIDEIPVYQLNKKSEQVHTGTFSSLRQYLVAASILIAGMLVLYNVVPGNEDVISGVSPIAAIEYDVERSAEAATLLDTHLQRAVAYSAGGNLSDALAEINLASGLELSGDQLIELGMVKGAIYYNATEFEQASVIFSELSTQPDIDNMNLEKSLWYLANSQIQMGQLDMAKANIEMVIDLDGAFSRVANNTLNSF